jgi:hypothetical protein
MALYLCQLMGAAVRGDMAVYNCVHMFETITFFQCVYSSELVSLHKPATLIKKKYIDDLLNTSFQFSHVKRKPIFSWHVTKESRKTVFFCILPVHKYIHRIYI